MPIGTATVVESSSASPSDTGVWFTVVPAPACTVLATPLRAFVPDVFPGLASLGRRLVYIGFDNVFGIDVVEAVVEEGVDAEDVVEADVDEAPSWVCQTRGHVGDEGMHRCC